MMRRATIRVWITAVGALLVCGGCGFKGPLYLPERNATVVTHPAKNKGKTAQPPPASQPSQSPGSPPQGSPPTSPPTPPPQSVPTSPQ
jgi:predicted small lipoprotein YifL